MRIRTHLTRYIITVSPTNSDSTKVHFTDTQEQTRYINHINDYLDHENLESTRIRHN